MDDLVVSVAPEIKIVGGERIFGPLTVEEPAVCNYAKFLGTCSLGAFSAAMADCEIRDADIGRYVSIAPQVVINPGEHPTTWLTTCGLAVDPASVAMADMPSAVAIARNTPFSRPVTSRTADRSSIGHDVWIGRNAIVLQGINVGIGAVIGAGAVVIKDVPPFAIMLGNPARFIRWRFDEETRARILASRWWEYDLSHIPHRDYSDVHGMLDQIERAQPPKLEPRTFTYGARSPQSERRSP